MKTFLKTLSFFLIINQIYFAQWFWQNPIPQGNTLLGVSFSDPNNGTAVGYFGTIIRTTDAGTTWVNQESGTMEILRDVSFADANNGTIVGEHGLILNTKDGGKTWNKQTSGTTETLYGVSFSDVNNGTAVGVLGTILRTTNGGNIWAAQQSSISGTYCALLSVSFTDINNGTFVGSDGIVQHTTDGGNTWVAQSSGTIKSLSSVSFLDVNNGIAVGSGGTVIRTNNAGATWTLMQVTENHLADVSFTDINNCLIVGNNATVVRVTNAGADWYRYYPAATKVEEGTDLYGASYNTFVGEKGQIFCFNENDSSWIAQRKGPIAKLRGVSFTSSNIGTAVGHFGTILRTTDGGNTWTPQSNDLPPYYSNNMKAVSFIDANNGYIVTGLSYSDSIGNASPYSSILRTTNGGTTWNVCYSYYADVAFNGISSPSANVCIAVGVYEIDGIDQAGWASTTDGGANWRARYWPNIKDPLTDVSFINNDIGTLVGHKGRIMRTTDGAITWNTQSAGITKNLHGVCFTDANNGTVVGDDGTILHTANGGTKWITQSSGTTKDLYGVHFTDANHGKVVGSNGTILNTTDGGMTWSIQSKNTDNDLFAVAFTDENIGSVVGDNGVILRTTNGGITAVFEEKGIEPLKKYILSQNYPNPFNPATNIQYTVSSLFDGKAGRQNVTLKVYDVLGIEVAILVNEEKETGNYEIEFNAEKFSSGVYFYRIQAGDFVDTKKMLLLK